MWVYIVFNVFIAVGLYWLARVVSRLEELRTRALADRQPKNKRKEQAAPANEPKERVTGEKR